MATLQFSGGFTVSGSGSLVDGNYDLTVDGSKISSTGGRLLDANRDGVGGGQHVFGDEAADASLILRERVVGDGPNPDLSLPQRNRRHRRVRSGFPKLWRRGDVKF